MPLDTLIVAKQIEAAGSAFAGRRQEADSAIAQALRLYQGTSDERWEERLHTPTTRRWWASKPRTPLNELSHHEPCEPSYCIVAADGSYIAPDRHRGAMCHLVNVGTVMIRYGADQDAALDSLPTHYPETPGEETGTGKVLEAQMALCEIEQLYELAKKHGAALAMLDGSLMQLTLLLSRDDQVQQFMGEYYRLLGAFRALGVPVVGYISRSRAQMVMRVLRMLACPDKPCERRPAIPCPCAPLWSIDDADLFWAMLGPGHCSPLFQPRASYPGNEQAGDLLFAYLGVDYEIARLEFPGWVAEDGLLERTLGIIMHQCKLGQGYPNSLALAHQWAVLHNADRESYYFLLERAGMLGGMSEKALSKRATGQAV